MNTKEITKYILTLKSFVQNDNVTLFLSFAKLVSTLSEDNVDDNGVKLILEVALTKIRKHFHENMKRESTLSNNKYLINELEKLITILGKSDNSSKLKETLEEEKEKLSQENKKKSDNLSKLKETLEKEKEKLSQENKKLGEIKQFKLIGTCEIVNYCSLQLFFEKFFPENFDSEVVKGRDMDVEEHFALKFQSTQKNTNEFLLIDMYSVNPVLKVPIMSDQWKKEKLPIMLGGIIEDVYETEKKNYVEELKNMKIKTNFKGFAITPDRMTYIFGPLESKILKTEIILLMKEEIFRGKHKKIPEIKIWKSNKWVLIQGDEKTKISYYDIKHNLNNGSVNLEYKEVKSIDFLECVGDFLNLFLDEENFGNFLKRIFKDNELRKELKEMLKNI